MINRIFIKASAILSLVLICSLTGLRAQTTDLDKAITASKNERYDRADSILQIVAKNAPSSKVYFRLGENTLLNFFSDSISNSLKVVTTEAKEYFNKGVAQNASDPLNYIGLARVASLIGDKNTAEQMRLKAKSFLLPYKKVTKIPNPQEYAYTLAKIAESYIIFDRVDTALALPNIREALTIDQKNGEIFIIAGDIYLLVNNGSVAIKMYNKAQDIDLKSPTANMKIGSIYFKGRNFAAAIPYYEQAIALDKNFAPAYRELGQLYKDAARLKESKDNYEIYLQLTNQNIPAKIRYVISLFYSKDYAAVIKNVEDIFIVDKSRIVLNRLAGYSSYEMGNYPQAQTYMDHLFANLPADKFIQKDYIYYARILLKKNSTYSKVYTELERANADLSKQKEKTEALKGPAKEKEKANDEALAAKVAEIHGRLDMMDKEITKAYESYEKAITFKEEEDANLIQEKANSQYNNKRYVDAADTWKRLIAKGKDSEENMIQIGRAYYQGKEYDKADDLLNQLIAKYPNYIPAYSLSARNAFGKDPDSKLGLAKPKFIALISKASSDSVKYNSEILEGLSFLGYQALQADNYELARAYYTRMANLDPNNQEVVIKAYSSLATMYLQKGEYPKATEYYNKIIALDPGNEAAKSSLKYIIAVQSGQKPKAHPNEISGVIKDSSGQPIAGVDIRVKDTAAEAWTNAKGEYRFTMPEESKSLIISAKGYKTIEVPVTAKRVYSATLAKE